VELRKVERDCPRCDLRVRLFLIRCVQRQSFAVRQLFMLPFEFRHGRMIAVGQPAPL
jgi:hypothetical protein